jgi:short-subunit dehydrogenase
MLNIDDDETMHLKFPRSLLSQASKAAALSFYDTLRMELGSDIRITEVVPGVVESEITKGKMLTKGGEMKVDQDERDVRTSVARTHASDVYSDATSSLASSHL